MLFPSPQMIVDLLKSRMMEGDFLWLYNTSLVLADTGLFFTWVSKARSCLTDDTILSKFITSRLSNGHTKPVREALRAFDAMGFTC